MAKVDELMNLARPKSETLMIEVAGFLDEYNRFSGYKIISIFVRARVSKYLP